MTIADQNDRKALDQAAKRISLADLSVDDLAAVIGDVIKNQRREILKHVQRLLTLAEVKQHDPHEKIRLDRIARRVTQIESELRMVRKDRGGYEKGVIARLSGPNIPL